MSKQEEGVDSGTAKSRKRRNGAEHEDEDDEPGLEIVEEVEDEESTDKQSKEPDTKKTKMLEERANIPEMLVKKSEEPKKNEVLAMNTLPQIPAKSEQREIKPNLSDNALLGVEALMGLADLAYMQQSSVQSSVEKKTTSKTRRNPRRDSKEEEEKKKAASNAPSLSTVNTNTPTATPALLQTPTAPSSLIGSKSTAAGLHSNITPASLNAPGILSPTSGASQSLASLLPLYGQQTLPLPTTTTSLPSAPTTERKVWKRCATHVAIAYYIFYQQRHQLLQVLCAQNPLYAQKIAPFSLDPTYEARVLKERSADMMKRKQVTMPMQQQLASPYLSSFPKFANLSPYQYNIRPESYGALTPQMQAQFAQQLQSHLTMLQQQGAATHHFAGGVLPANTSMPQTFLPNSLQYLLPQPSVNLNSMGVLGSPHQLLWGRSAGLQENVGASSSPSPASVAANSTTNATDVKKTLASPTSKQNQEKKPKSDVKTESKKLVLSEGDAEISPQRDDALHKAAASVLASSTPPILSVDSSNNNIISPAKASAEEQTKEGEKELMQAPVKQEQPVTTLNASNRSVFDKEKEQSAQPEKQHTIESKREA